MQDSQRILQVVNPQPQRWAAGQWLRRVLLLPLLLAEPQQMQGIPRRWQLLRGWR